MTFWVLTDFDSQLITFNVRSWINKERWLTGFVVISVTDLLSLTMSREVVLNHVYLALVSGGNVSDARKMINVSCLNTLKTLLDNI